MAVTGASWNKTVIAEQRLAAEGKLHYVNGEAFCERWRVIHRDSPINGGVYMGSGQREAIFVDYDFFSDGLKGLFSEAKTRATVNGAVDKGMVLNAVYDVVKGAMPYDEDKVDEWVGRCGAGEDKPMNLNIFVENKAGLCRHMALTCGVLLEKFKEEGHIRGTPGVDRNSNSKGGHAWCRYKNFAGEVFILDPAREYIGALKDAPDDKRWPYERPDDF